MITDLLFSLTFLAIGLVGVSRYRTWKRRRELMARQRVVRVVRNMGDND